MIWSWGYLFPGEWNTERIDAINNVIFWESIQGKKWYNPRINKNIDRRFRDLSHAQSEGKQQLNENSFRERERIYVMEDMDQLQYLVQIFTVHIVHSENRAGRQVSSPFPSNLQHFTRFGEMIGTYFIYFGTYFMYYFRSSWESYQIGKAIGVSFANIEGIRSALGVGNEDRSKWVKLEKETYSLSRCRS